MDKLNVSDRVKVEYEGTVYNLMTEKTEIRDSSGLHHFYKKDSDVTITRIMPEVELGDLWQIPCGSVYVVRKSFGNLVLVAIAGPDYSEPPAFFKLYPHATRIFRLSEKGIKL